MILAQFAQWFQSKCLTFERKHARVIGTFIYLRLIYLYEYTIILAINIWPMWANVVPTKSDSDVIFWLQLLSKNINLYTTLEPTRIDRSCG